VSTPDRNVQTAPYPVELERMVEALAYKPGWRFWLANEDRDTDDGVVLAGGLTLTVLVVTPNSYHPEQEIRVRHLFPVPAATYNKQSWRRWLLEQILLVERHEACEFFRLEYEVPNRVGIEVLGTSRIVERPFAPNHGPGFDPYIIFELTTARDRATSFRGEVKK
jgi:hypothetical protein